MEIPDFSSPSLWKATAYVHAPLETDIENFQKLGYEESELLALLYLRGLRRQVIQTGLSLFITIEGRHQSGKSRLGAGIGCLFSKDFRNEMGRYIVRTAEELLAIVKYIQINKIKYPVIMVDEAGAALSSNEWLDTMNVALMKTLNIIGWLKPTLIFIAPTKDFILSGIRKMTNVVLKVFRSKKEYAVVVPYNLFYESNRKKMWHIHPIIKLFGIPRKIKIIRFYMPPDEINNKYEEIERERKPVMLEGIRDDAVQTRIFEEKKYNRKELDINKIVDSVVKNYKIYELQRSKEGAVKLNAELIIHEFKNEFGVIPARTGSLIKSMAEKRING